MPCNAVRTISLDLSVADRSILEKTVKSMNWTIEGNIITTERGTIVLQGDKAIVRQGMEDQVNSLRFFYAKEVVNHAANKLGWQKVQAGGNKLTLKRGM